MAESHEPGDDLPEAELEVERTRIAGVLDELFENEPGDLRLLLPAERLFFQWQSGQPVLKVLNSLLESIDAGHDYLPSDENPYLLGTILASRAAQHHSNLSSLRAVYNYWNTPELTPDQSRLIEHTSVIEIGGYLLAETLGRAVPSMPGVTPKIAFVVPDKYGHMLRPELLADVEARAAIVGSFQVVVQPASLEIIEALRAEGTAPVDLVASAFLFHHEIFDSDIVEGWRWEEWDMSGRPFGNLVVNPRDTMLLAIQARAVRVGGLIVNGSMITEPTPQPLLEALGLQLVSHSETRVDINVEVLQKVRENTLAIEELKTLAHTAWFGVR